MMTQPTRQPESLFDAIRHHCEVCDRLLTTKDRQRATGICDVCWAAHDEFMAEEAQWLLSHPEQGAI